MSKLFFDNLVDLSDLDRTIKNSSLSQPERDEMRQLVDEIVHHRVMDCILDHLPHEHHEEFLVIYHDSPHDEDTIFEYLKNKIGENIRELIRQEIGALGSDLLEDMKSSKSRK